MKLTINKTELTREQIACKLNAILKQRKIKAQYFINNGWQPLSVYAILQIGVAKKTNYKIESLLKFMSEINVTFKDLE